MPMPNGVVAWRGENTATRRRGFSLQLYRTTWENPVPGAEIASLDFISRLSSSAPFLVAITADPLVADEHLSGPSLIERIQADADSFPHVRTGGSYGQPDFQILRLNTEQRRSGSVFYDAFRITTPPEPGWDLVWVAMAEGLASFDSWNIIPARGRMRIGFEDWYHGARAHYRDLPDEGRRDLLLQYLDGKKLQPASDYLIWFAFNSEEATGLRFAVTFLPPGMVSPGAPDSLEAAMGLERIDTVTDTGDITQHANCGPGLHRHFCLGPSHW
jgi:hypothetical protein